ncbi:hypothetical protein ACFVIB_01610 [Streptomyces nigra]|uniref:hypothetical protein n=1 Tax=Streptomyces nigra TaxID=1827580 RepID=UPI00362DE030
MHKNQDPDTPLADPRSAFVTEVIALARKHRNAVRAQAVTKSGHTVLLTGMWGKASARSTSPPPDGFEARRADGWKISKTAEVAAFLWDVMEQDRSRAAERAHLLGPGPENSNGRYMPLTPQMAAQTQQALQAASDWWLEHDADIAL